MYPKAVSQAPPAIQAWLERLRVAIRQDMHYISEMTGGAVENRAASYS
jgi:hypothetical protein